MLKYGPLECIRCVRLMPPAIEICSFPATNFIVPSLSSSSLCLALINCSQAIFPPPQYPSTSGTRTVFNKSIDKVTRRRGGELWEKLRSTAIGVSGSWVLFWPWQTCLKERNPSFVTFVGSLIIRETAALWVECTLQHFGRASGQCTPFANLAGDAVEATKIVWSFDTT